ncbi:hypothetical protein EDD99_6095 [Streptomyces sp. 846.5]|nr:hypothetical protein [Streptomyces sp. 846.5]TDT97894.1 hypothetical protein EDD99_6095 [Streptomyces sp. 846.5]
MQDDQAQGAAAEETTAQPNFLMRWCFSARSTPIHIRAYEPIWPATWVEFPNRKYPAHLCGNAFRFHTMLRSGSAVTYFRRTAARNTELGGQQTKKGHSGAGEI